MEYISQEKIRDQAWKFYFVAFAWPLYLFLLPAAAKAVGVFALPLMIFPGVYLFTWVGYLMHESWHRYVPNVPNSIFYKLFSWMLVTDPQIYHMLHGGHHMNVNSWEDTEFHPLGKIHTISLRRLYNFLEITIGIAFIVTMTSLVVPFDTRYKQQYRLLSLLLSVIVWVVFIAGIGYLSHRVFAVSATTVFLSFTANFWLDSFFLHHSQMVEHGNLIAVGDWSERNIRTRNLKADGLIEKIFLFLTHGDSREHVLHHTLVRVYSRPFPGMVPMPPGAVYISIKDYFGILRGMLTENVP